MAAQLTFYGLSAVALAGAATVVLTRDVMRLVVGLGAFLLAVAGFYVYYGLALLAAAQLFVYVGGVLVLVLFALMLLSRDTGGRLELGTRLDIGAITVSLGLFVLLVATLGGAAPQQASAGGLGLPALGRQLLGPSLPAFELLGVLLLASLLAVVTIVGGGERK
jgi:NADH-quinone oxidoreductase subunit J